MARKRASARDQKERRAAQIISTFQSNLKMVRTALRALETNAKELGELLAELTEKESPPCSDSGPSNPSSG